MDFNIVIVFVWWRDSMSYIIIGGKELFEIDSFIKVVVLSFFDRIWELLLFWFFDFVGVFIFLCVKEYVCG